MAVAELASPELAQRPPRPVQAVNVEPPVAALPVAPLPPASLIGDAATQPDVVARAKMSKGLQRSVGNARTGAMAAPPPAGEKRAAAAAPAAAGKSEERKPGRKGGSRAGDADREAGAPVEKSGSKEAAGRAIAIKMPAPRAGLTSASKARVAKVQSAAGKTAGAQATLPSVDEHVTDAQDAVQEPSEESNARAEMDLVGKLDKQATPSPQIEELCQRIYAIIEAQRPPDEEQLVKAEPDKMAQKAGDEMAESVQVEVAGVDGSYNALDQDPAGTPIKKDTPLPPPPTPEATPDIHAQQATPDAVPAKNVSLDADVAQSKERMDAAGMNSEPAKLAKSGPVAEARAAEGELEQTAAEDPAQVLAGQQATLVKAGGDMAALQRKALAALKLSRSTTVTGTRSNQNKLIGNDESQRKAASTEAKGIYTSAQKLVEDQLKDLPGTAKKNWDEGVKFASIKFKQKLKDVEDWIKERHSGFGGSVVGKLDDWFGLPIWVTLDYIKAEREFGDEICAVARKVSISVNTVIMACEQIIESARLRIDKVFADLPEHLQKEADAEKANFHTQLNGLTKQAHDVRDHFNEELIQSASEAVDDVRQQIHALREKAKGLLGRLVDAIGRFLDDPVKFIIEALLDLVGIPPAAFWAVVAKIKKVIGDIADDPIGFGSNLLAALSLGFSQFFDNFESHLLQGFVNWLLSGLKSVGVTLPKDGSLKSILTFMLQVMGITWPNIRKILLKHLGPKNVAMIDKVLSLIATLIELGPEGIFELIKEKLDPKNIVDTIVNAAVDYMMTAIVKAVSARILLLFNPVGAILQALEAIYRVLKWVFQNAAKIFTLIETVVNGVAELIAGNIAGMANAVEKALAGLIAPVIAFLADYLNFGDLPMAIADLIKGLQGMVLEALESVIVWLIEKGKALLGMGEQGKPGAPDLEGKVPFSADGENHNVWVDVQGSSAVVMVASDKPTPIETRIAEWKVASVKLPSKGKKNPKAKADELIPKAEALASSTDKTAEALIRQSEAAKEGAEGNPPADTGELSAKESELAAILKELFELFGESWAKPSEKWEKEIGKAEMFCQPWMSKELDDHEEDVRAFKQWPEVRDWLETRPELADPLNGKFEKHFWEMVADTSGIVRAGRREAFKDRKKFGELEKQALADDVASGSSLRTLLLRGAFGEAINVRLAVKTFVREIPPANVSFEKEAKDPWHAQGTFVRNRLQYAFPKQVSWKATLSSTGWENHSHHIWPTYLMGPDHARVDMKQKLHRVHFHEDVEKPLLPQKLGVARTKVGVRQGYLQAAVDHKEQKFIDTIREGLKEAYDEFDKKYVGSGAFATHCIGKIDAIPNEQLLTPKEKLPGRKQ